VSRLSLIAILLLAGCATVSDSSINPMNWFGSKSPAAKMAELPEIKASVTLRPLWQASAGNSGDSVFSPVIAKDSVFAAAADGTVSRFDAVTGKPIWRVNAGERLSSGVGADGDTVVVATSKGDVIALNGEGVVVWKAKVTSEVLAAPVVVGDLVVVRSADSRIYAFNAKDGKRRWVYQRATPTLSVRSPTGVSIGRGNVYAGFSGGKMMALTLSNGGVRWESTVALPKGATEIERVTDVVGLPLVSEREVCAVAYQGRVACFDSNSGAVGWSREMSSTSGLGGDARTIFVSDDKGGVHALDRTSGNSLWKQDKLFLRNLSAPIGFGNQVVVADIQGYVHLLSRESGAFVGRAATDGSPVSTKLLAFDRGFLVQTRNGNIFAFGTPN
jgi:outer membrane protein assembly factor BamB